MDEVNILQRIAQMSWVDYMSNNKAEIINDIFTAVSNQVSSSRYNILNRTEILAYVVCLILQDWRQLSVDDKNKNLSKYIYLITSIFENELKILLEAYPMDDYVADDSDDMEYKVFMNMIIYFINKMLTSLYITENAVVVDELASIMKEWNESILNHLYLINGKTNQYSTSRNHSIWYDCLYSPNFYAIGVYFVTYICEILVNGLRYKNENVGFHTSHTFEEIYNIIEENKSFAMDLSNGLVVIEEGGA